MIGCSMVKFAYVFKNCWEVEEELPECQLPKNMYWYIGSTLVDSYNDHVCAIVCSKERVACLMPNDMPGDLFRKYGS